MFKKKRNQNNRFSRTRFEIITIVVIAIGWGGYFTHMTGCSWGSSPKKISDSIEKPNLTQEQQSVEQDALIIDDISESVGESAELIDNETNTVRGIVDEDTGAIIEPNLSSINNETQSLRNDSAELKRVRESLNETSESLFLEQRKVDDLELSARTSLAEIESLKDQNKELKSEASQLLKEKMAWIGVISVLGIGVCVILAFLTRSMTATLIAIGFVITLGVSIAVSLYMSTIAWVTISVAGVSVLGVLAYLGYNTFVQNKSVDELVQTGEVTKNYLSQEARDYIFGRGAEPGIADQVQSKDTKKLVRQIRRYDASRRGFDLASREPQKAKLPKIPETDTYVSDPNQENSSY